MNPENLPLSEMHLTLIKMECCRIPLKSTGVRSTQTQVVVKGRLRTPGKRNHKIKRALETDSRGTCKATCRTANLMLNRVYAKKVTDKSYFTWHTHFLFLTYYTQKCLMSQMILKGLENRIISNSLSFEFVFHYTKITNSDNTSASEAKRRRKGEMQKPQVSNSRICGT